MGAGGDCWGVCRPPSPWGCRTERANGAALPLWLCLACLAAAAPSASASSPEVLEAYSAGVPAGRRPGCASLRVASHADIAVLHLDTPAAGESPEPTSLPDNILAIRSAEYGADGKGWRDVRNTVTTHGIAITEESVGSPIEPGLQLKVVYFRNDTGSALGFLSVGLRFMLELGLDPEGLYGCASHGAGGGGGGAEAPVSFASGCACPAGQQCKERDLRFLFEEQEYIESVGECGCCSTSITFLVVAVPLVVFAVAVGWLRLCLSRCATCLLGGREKASRRYRRLRRKSPGGGGGVSVVALSPTVTALSSPRSPNPLELSPDEEVCSVPPLSLSRRDLSPPPMAQLR